MLDPVQVFRHGDREMFIQTSLMNGNFVAIRPGNHPTTGTPAPTAATRLYSKHKVLLSPATSQYMVAEATCTDNKMLRHTYAHAHTSLLQV